jgi:hypothetical protein
MQRATSVRPLEAFTAIFAALACLFITIVLWRNVSAYQAMWPLPALYFIELPALAMLSALAFLSAAPEARFITWAVVGMFGAFCIVGGFSVGLTYLPITLLFAGLSIASDLRNRAAITPHLAVCLLAALLQAALMLTAIRWLYPAAAF